MITVTFGTNISKDGYCDHTIGNPSEGLFHKNDGRHRPLFYGRIMYELMFPCWLDVAKKICSLLHRRINRNKIN